MTTFRQVQDEVLLTLHGYGLAQPRASFLTAEVSATALALPVTNAADFDMGLAEVGSELVFVESVDRSTNTITLSPDGRGYYGSTAASHASGARVTFAPTWPRSRVAQAINDTILGTHPTLFGVAQTQFAFTPSVTTYSLPAEVERVLSVTADVNGPSREQQIIRRYSFSSSAPTDDWATTNTLTLQEPASPGRTVTVTYAKRPSALALDADALTTSGLRETAKRALVYGACAQLVTFMDVSRLPVDSSTADEIDDRNSPGMASRIGNQLQLRYEMELEQERQRLRAATPIAISVRTR